VSSTRRVVRATPRFFEDLDRQLRSERGPSGEPSTNDFQVFELIRIVDRFAVEFDDLPRLRSHNRRRTDPHLFAKRAVVAARLVRAHWGDRRTACLRGGLLDSTRRS